MRYVYLVYICNVIKTINNMKALNRNGLIGFITVALIFIYLIVDAIRTYGVPTLNYMG